MKTVEELIIRARRESRNKTTGSLTAGNSIDDPEFVDALQDAQELCVELISGVFSKLFHYTYVYTIDTSADSCEVLTLPSDCFMDSRVVSVEYSYNGDAENYMNLYPKDIRERYSGTSFARCIEGYMRTGNQIILTDTPSQNGAKIRLVYERSPYRLDITKASVLTASRVGAAYTLTYDTATAKDDIADYWQVGDSVNVMNSNNNTMIVAGAEISSINTVTGDIVLDLTDATYTEAVVDAATATALRLIEGGRTNISSLPDLCEKYLANYAIFSILDRDGSKLAERAEKRFSRISDSLLKSYISEDKDWPSVSEDYY